MDPSMLGGMAEMFKNPEMMKSMESMMENPEMQKMLNDPNMINNMMNILGGAGINIPTQPPMPTESEPTSTIEEYQPAFQTGDVVVIHNLKKEEYNNLQGTIVTYLEDSERYVVLLENNKKLSIKEANIKAHEELEIVD